MKRLGFFLLLFTGAMVYGVEAKLHGWMLALPFPSCDEVSLANYGGKLPAGTQLKRVAETARDRAGLGGRAIAPDYFQAPEKNAKVNFGGGVELQYLNDTFLKCEPGSNTIKHQPNEKRYYEYHQQNFKDDEPGVLITLNGFVSHGKPARIRGEVSFQFDFTDFSFTTVLPNAGPFAGLVPAVSNEIAERGLILVIAHQTVDGKWMGDAYESNPIIGTQFGPIPSKFMHRGMHHWAVEAEVPARSKVRLFLAANWGTLRPTRDGAKANRNTLRVYDARLFGAECYPDFSGSDKCLGD